jgi:hypothetical protein
VWDTLEFFGGSECGTVWSGFGGVSECETVWSGFGE